MKDYYKLSVDETLNELSADPAGLSPEKAAERLAQYGPNKLKEAEKPGFWKRFLMQLKDPMLLILLAAAGVSALTGAIAGESEWAETIIDAETDHMVAGIAFHWYSGDHFEALRMLRERFPKKKLLLSEACIEFSKYSAEDNLANAQKYAHDIIGNLNEGMSVFLDWNLVLDELGGPNHVKNFCDAPYLFDTARKQLVERELQSYIKHFSHYIETGAVRIGVSRYTDKLKITAFQKNSKIVFVLLNRTQEAIPAFIRLNDTCAGLIAASNSIATGVVNI